MEPTSLALQDTMSPESVTATLAMEKEPLSLGDYEAIKAALVEGKRTDARNVLICKVLFGTGLREAEVLRICPEHIEVNGPDVAVLIQRGKKKRRRWERVYLHPGLGLDLRNYVQGNQIPLTSPVFNVSARQLQRIIKAAGIRALGRDVHPHMFRALYAKVLIDNGLPLAAASKMLGHSDVKTTTEFYYQLTADQRASINRRLPV